MKYKNQEIIEFIKQGKIFIYPTDTIYGIGCDATNSSSVRKIRKLKGSKKPFSVIASKSWIRQNCYIKGYEKYLKKLPGAYTFILKLKNKNAVCRETNQGTDTIGIRIPKHPFTKVIIKSKRPFITTSVNETGKRFAMKIKDISNKFKNHAVIINVGEIKGKPSKIYDLTLVKSIRIQ